MKQGYCISKIYDAATSESQWDETMDVVAQYTGAKGCILLSTNVEAGGKWELSRPSKLWRQVPIEERNFIAKEFVKYDLEAWKLISQLDKHAIYHDGDNYEAESLDTRPDFVFYRENYGFNRRLGSRLTDHPSWMESITLQFEQTTHLVPQESQRALAGIVQHLAKVTELNRSFAVLEQRYQAVLMALDHIHIGVCIAQTNGEIILSNKEADRILDDKDSLWMSAEKKLTFREREKNAELQQAIVHAVGATGGEGSQVELLMHAERASGKRAVLIEVAPLSDGLREIQLGFQGALIYLIDPENPVPIKIERLALACGLSEAESAVCERVAHGWKNGDIAEDRNVSLDTIKTQIAHVFSKTGVSNRSELIRLILKSSPPVG